MKEREKKENNQIITRAIMIIKNSKSNKVDYVIPEVGIMFGIVRGTHGIIGVMVMGYLIVPVRYGILEHKRFIKREG